MREDPERRKERIRRNAEQANRTIMNRTLHLMLIFGIAAFVVLLGVLFKEMVLEHDEYEKKATRNQTTSVSLTASRGTVYDRNMNILAASASVEDVYVNSSELEKAAKAEKPQDNEALARGLSEILGVELETVLKQMHNTNYNYNAIKMKVSHEDAQKVRDFVIDNGYEGVHLETDYQRYYPYTSLAAQVIGFVRGDNVGGDGVEAFYDDALTGNAGKVITTRGNNGTAMLYTYEKYYDAADGNSLVLTIDSTVQYYLEKNLQSAIEKYTVLNGAFGIVMDVNTGEVLAMATEGSYDPNNYLEIFDTDKNQQLEEMYLQAVAAGEGSEAYKSGLDTYNNEVGKARLRQWRNRAVSDGYEPGSTFKLITLASALNNNAVTLNDEFYCGGAADFKGRSQTLHCWQHNGHGMQSTSQALGNSCNIAFANIGLKLGGAAFYDYARAFGLMETTGIDLPGEANGYFFARENLTGASTASLISGSFGQTFKVTPLQMVRAVSAIVNGGYLLEPYVVSQELDADGNIVRAGERKVLRQVISEETSATMRQLMEFVVTDGTASKAKTAGYRVGGKTATSEKIDEFNEDGSPVEDKIVSFIGVAPINEPKYIVLVALDTPSRATGLYISGGVMAAPTVRDVFTDILPYLGVEPDYGNEDISAINVAVPNVQGATAAEAEALLKEKSLTYRAVGEGERVTAQIPATGAEVPGNSEIVLYFDAEVSQEPVVLPDFYGMTPDAAYATARDCGVYLQSRGSDKVSGYIFATYQSIAAGTEVPRGTTINVEFTNNSVQD